MGRLDDLETVRPRDVAEWRAWLETEGPKVSGVWLVLAKKGSREPGVGYEDAVLEAVAHGWIDGQTRAVDADTYRILIARRKPGGTWARSNKERVERLTAEGRMAPEGIAAVEAAKADGSWDLLEDVDALVVPPDLAEALAADPQARANFDAFPDSVKKLVLYHVGSAKRAETRAKRIAEAVRDARDGVRRIAP